MSRGAHTFKQCDVTRAIKAARAAGVEIAGIEVDVHGTIRIIAGKAVDVSRDLKLQNEWDGAKPM